MIRPTLFALGIWLSSSSVLAFDLNDCIINGMKGVSSDIAARQVRYACDQKHKTYKQGQLDRLSKEFGDVVEIDTLKAAKYSDLEGPGFQSMLYTNESGDKTVTFVRLAVTPAPLGPGTACDASKRRVFAYKVTVKPLDTIKLIYPAPALAICLEPLVVIARTPSWKDVSFSSSAKPSDKDPFADLD